MLEKIMTPAPVLEAINALEGLYIFEKPAQVVEYLENHQFLIALLYEAYPKLKSYFPSAQLLLEVVRDPESVDFVELAVFVVPADNDTESMNKLHQFEDDWWLDMLDLAQNKLSIMTEYR